MNEYNSIFIAIITFFMVIVISYLMDVVLFTKPNKNEDRILIILKILVEISIICIFSYLLLSNISELTVNYNLDKNAIVLPNIIAWILVVNYFFKNKLFGKFSILLDDIKVNFNNISKSELSIKKNLLGKQNLNLININKKQTNPKKKLNISDEEVYDLNNSNNSIDNSDNNSTINSNNNLINNSNNNSTNNSNNNSINNSNNNSTNNSTNIDNIVPSENINENNKNIFSKFHNKDWFKMNLRMNNFYPELLNQNNNISDGKYEYVEINNLKN